MELGSVRKRNPDRAQWLEPDRANEKAVPGLTGKKVKLIQKKERWRKEARRSRWAERVQGSVAEDVGAPCARYVPAV